MKPLLKVIFDCDRSGLEANDIPDTAKVTLMKPADGRLGVRFASGDRVNPGIVRISAVSAASAAAAAGLSVGLRILAVGDDENLGNAAQLAQSIADSGQSVELTIGDLRQTVTDAQAPGSAPGSGSGSGIWGT